MKRYVNDFNKYHISELITGIVIICLDHLTESNQVGCDCVYVCFLQWSLSVLDIFPFRFWIGQKSKCDIMIFNMLIG